MIVDLLHNKIVKETMSEAFERSVNENLVPKLSTLYGTSLLGIQMYEDYLNDDFSKDGYWYYPLTVLIADINAVIWIKWDVSDTSKFDGKNPYAYLGEGIDFVIADDVPMAFKSALDGRDSYFGSGFVKTNVVTDGHSASILVGKYSQTFIDEMTRQISAVIEKSCGVSGIANSSIEIDVVFAHNTYMEHTSENVTYRRLLISAKGCAPRDFWIKWTRRNSSVAYSVNDNVNKDDIIFELGEDVPHKTREKEYRFLVYGNSDKYRVAMGRKNITEWRELIKRAVKRGELEKTTTELERDAHVSEVSDKLSEILEKYGMTIPTSSEPEVKVNADVANEALRHAVLGDVPEAELEVSSYDVSDEAVAELEIDENTEVTEDSLATAEDNVFTFAGLEITDEAAVVEDDFNFDKEHEQFEIIIPEGSDPSLAEILSDFVPGANEADDDFDAAEREDMSVAMDETFTLVDDSDGEQLAEAEREFYELESEKNAPADVCNEEKIREKLEAEYLENVATLNSELEIARAEIISLSRITYVSTRTTRLSSLLRMVSHSSLLHSRQLLRNTQSHLQ